MTGEGKDHWGSVAAGWAAGSEQREAGPPGAAARWMLEAASLSAGDRVLELAAGVGDVGLAAAEVVGPSGRVLCSDYAEGMVDAVRERAANLPQLEARVLDAMDLRLDERFDAVLCRFGYMLMPDPQQALRASRAVLDDGGRLAFAVWGPAERNPWLSDVTDPLMEVLGAPPPEPGTPGPFSLGDPERVRSLLRDAGFGDATVEVLELERTYPSLEEWWRGSSAGEGAAHGPAVASRRRAARRDPGEGARARRRRRAGRRHRAVPGAGGLRARPRLSQHRRARAALPASAALAGRSRRTGAAPRVSCAGSCSGSP